MKVIELVQALQALGQPNLEVVAHYPEFDYLFNIEKVELMHFKDAGVHLLMAMADKPKFDQAIELLQNAKQGFNHRVWPSGLHEDNCAGCENQRMIEDAIKLLREAPHQYT